MLAKMLFRLLHWQSKRKSINDSYVSFQIPCKCGIFVFQLNFTKEAGISLAVRVIEKKKLLFR